MAIVAIIFGVLAVISGGGTLIYTAVSRNATLDRMLAGCAVCAACLMLVVLFAVIDAGGIP